MSAHSHRHDHGSACCGGHDHGHEAAKTPALARHDLSARSHDHADGHGHGHKGHDHRAHDHAGHVHGASCSHADHADDEVTLDLAAAARSWKVEGMDCGSCATTIRTAMERFPGVSDIRISITNETLHMVVDETVTNAAAIEKQIGQLGYKPTAIRRDAPSAPVPEAPASWWRTAKGQVAIASGLLVGLAMSAEYLFPSVGYGVYVAATLIAAAPIARRAIAAARAGAPFTIQMLMTIAVIGALIIGAAEEAAIVVFLFCVGEVLESIAANKARAGIRALAALVPQTALLETAGGPVEVSAASLAVGQTVLVRPGDRVPADGEVVSGISSVDESPITGESVPRVKEAGSDIFAGSINKEAAIRVKVKSAASDNMISRIVRLVEESQEAKAPTERFIDRFSRVYMPLIVGFSVLVAVVPPLFFGAEWGLWIYRALTLLLIGCPCALVISVPAAVAASLSTAARHGLLLKGGAVVENLADITTVVFDKTGTLTRGEPTVTDVVPLAGTVEDLLALSAGVESQSSHPLAEAIAAHAHGAKVTALAAQDVVAVPGKGMEGLVDGARLFIGAPRFAAERGTLDPALTARIGTLEDEGKTVVVVMREGVPAGLIALRDEPRADARAGIAALTALGVKAIMMTGDNARAGAAIGRSLGLEAKSQMLPSDKAEAVRAFAASTKVAMVGDGINDAPALASAHVGIAMGGGTDVALEAADAALLKNRVADVASLIRLSRSTMANIRQNIVIALGLKAVFLFTTLTGMTGLWIAILADTGATVLVTLNALRLLGFFRQEKRKAGRDGPTGDPVEMRPAVA